MVEVTEEEFELPDNLGPVATYEDGEVIEVEYSNNPMGVSIDSLKRLDGYIIGRVRCIIRVTDPVTFTIL
ncbi:hypothetical protein JCM19039_366 [Geomicrobium sp. JCM 19039]|nr:hypothetical protein JCM19039_366 [Geomicrobium sp. JCM 19039]